MNGSTTYKKETETLFGYGVISMIFIFDYRTIICYQYTNAILTPSNSYFFRSVASQRGDLDLQLDQDKDEKRKLEQKLLSFTNSHLGTSFHTLEFISFCQH